MRARRGGDRQPGPGQAGSGFLRDRDLRVDAGLHRRVIERRADGAAAPILRASAVAERLFGDGAGAEHAAAGDGVAAGLVPVGEAALLPAIELNGTAVALNQRAFLWGRLLATSRPLADDVLAEHRRRCRRSPALIERPGGRAGALRQSAAWPGATAPGRADGGAGGGPGGRPAGARPWRRVRSGRLAIKDEYEVARLHAAAELRRAPGVPHGPAAAAAGPTRRRAAAARLPCRAGSRCRCSGSLRHGKAAARHAAGRIRLAGASGGRSATSRPGTSGTSRTCCRACGPTPWRRGTELAGLPMEVRGFGPVREAAAMAAAAPRHGRR